MKKFLYRLFGAVPKQQMYAFEKRYGELLSQKMADRKLNISLDDRSLRAVALFCATLAEADVLPPSPLRRVSEFESYLLKGELDESLRHPGN